MNGRARQLVGAALAAVGAMSIWALSVLGARVLSPDSGFGELVATLLAGLLGGVAGYFWFEARAPGALPRPALRVDPITHVAADCGALTGLEANSPAALRRFREVAEGVHGVEALFDTDLRLEWISPSIQRLTDRTAGECLAAERFVDFLVYDSDRRYCQHAMQQVLASGQGRDFEMRLVQENGQVRWIASHWRPVLREDGAVAGLHLSAEDIQGRKEAEYKLLETVAQLRRAQALSENYLKRSNDERQRLLALLNVIRLGTLFMDRDHRVLYYNRAMLDIWRLPAQESLIGVRDEVLESRVADLLESPEAYFAHIRQVIAQHEVSEPFEIHLKDGRVLTDVSAVVEDGNRGRHGIGRVWIYEDITEQRNAERKLAALAERDPLTNLFNRRRFHEELERMLADAARRAVKVGLLAIDLDGFKPINDEFGHQAGDQVLVTLARAVGGIIRRNELFFRVGGDEFCVLVPEADAEDLTGLARRIVEGIGALRFVFSGRPASLTASLGLALYPDHASHGEALIAAADSAMYQAKNSGRNRWCIAEKSEGESARISTLQPDQPQTGEQ